MTIRSVSRTISATETVEGAGIRVRNAFGREEVAVFDPFLLLDRFGSDDPAQFLPGFPMHPHRGFQAIAYVLKGEVRHRDSVGNSGVIGKGDVQWMTAGRGIMHEEMGQGDVLDGLQLWINLPRRSKMAEPRYGTIPASEVGLVRREGCVVKVIAGTVDGTRGPVGDLVTPVELYDIELGPGAVFEHQVEWKHTCFAFVHEGKATFGPGPGRFGVSDQTVVLTDGDMVRIKGGSTGAGLLFASGAPLREPIAWGGSVVMNTEQEVKEALHAIGHGTFPGMEG